MPRLPGSRGALVSMDRSFDGALAKLQSAIKNWPVRAIANLYYAHKRITKKWISAARKRVPEWSKELRDSIDGVTIKHGQGVYSKVGSDLFYAKYIEFGTRYIAGGKVKALGTKMHITDAEAVTDWPAKHIKGTRKTVRRKRVKRASRKQSAQMPWLRPAWWSIDKWARAELSLALDPPPPTGMRRVKK